MKILVVTNDFPPRIGGIEDYVAQLLIHLPPDVSALVLAPRHLDAESFDQRFRHRICRWNGYPMLPTPQLARTVIDLIGEERPDVLVFGAAMPLALMAGVIRRRARLPIVAFTHGVEPATASLPGAGILLRTIARHSAAITVISQWAETSLRRVIDSRSRMVHLPSGIDAERFRPDVSGAAVRARYELGGRPVIACVSRLVRRKGQDQLIRSLRRTAPEFPDLHLLVVGDGPDRQRLRRLAAAEGVSSRVTFTGFVPYDELPSHFAAGDIFAMPCRSRLHNVENEGLGAVFLQAAAVGRPVIAGSCGGAPEAVHHGTTGLVIDGRDGAGIDAAILRLLRSADEARAFGARGAARVHGEMTWQQMSRRLYTLLEEVTSGSTTVSSTSAPP